MMLLILLSPSYITQGSHVPDIIHQIQPPTATDLHLSMDLRTLDGGFLFPLAL